MVENTEPFTVQERDLFILVECFERLLHSFVENRKLTPTEVVLVMVALDSAESLSSVFTVAQDMGNVPLTVKWPAEGDPAPIDDIAQRCAEKVREIDRLRGFG